MKSRSRVPSDRLIHRTALHEILINELITDQQLFHFLINPGPDYEVLLIKNHKFAAF